MESQIPDTHVSDTKQYKDIFNKQLTTNYKANRYYFNEEEEEEEEEHLLANGITRKSN